MAASVQVLCPNGRRQSVKINPNTKLLQILEEVCQRQGFIPPDDYKLVHGRKELDLSLSVRYSSLPNNAKLELTKCPSTRVEQDITIALQLDSGQRFQDSFKPAATLWDILLHFESKNSELKGVLTRVDESHSPALHPVCIYMREEVIGEPALSATTLRKLGMTSGKAILRLLHRPIEEHRMGQILSEVEKEKQKQAKLEEIAIKKSEMRQMDELDQNRQSHATLPLKSVGEERETNQPMEIEEEEVDVVSSSVAMTVCSDPPRPVDRLGDLPEDSRSSPTGSDHSSQKLRKPHTSAIKPPAQPTNEPTAGSSAISDLRNMNIPGVEIFTPDDFNDLSPQEQAIARRLAERFLGSQAPSQGQTASRQAPEPPAASFADFKFPEATRGMDLTGNDSDSNRYHNTQPCERDPIVYNADEPLQERMPGSNEDLPEDFFEVTQADVKLMYRDLQNAVQQLEDQPLMTRTMKQQEMEAMFDHYERIILRIQFPDRLVLQACFRPREPVSALYTFVKENIDDKNQKFYLYTAPPKEVIKDQKSTLAMSRLAPAALVYFGSETQKDHYIKTERRQKVRPRKEAEIHVTKVLKPKIDPADDSSGYGTTSSASTSSAANNPGPSAASRRPPASSFASSSRSNLPSGGQVPKWFKVGKK